MGATYTNRWPKTTPASILPSFTKEIWRRSVSSCIWHNNSWWSLLLSSWSRTKRTMKRLPVDNWTTSTQSSSKKSAGKRMVAVCFMKSGLIKAVPLETGATANASWYVNTYLWQVFSGVSERRETRTLRGLIFHDDNAKPHRAWVTNEFLLENHVKQYQSLAYSLDFSPCDFFLFSKLKKQLLGIQFNDDNEILTALEQATDSLRKEDFKNCFEDWFIRMHKCIDAEGQYFEKIN